MNKLVLYLTILTVLNINCISTGINTGINTGKNIKYREPIKEYELIDYNGILHSYKDDINKMVFPIHNKLLTQYCREHKSWEDIRAKWSQDKLAEPGNYRYNYYVKEN